MKMTPEELEAVRKSLGLDKVNEFIDNQVAKDAKAAQDAKEKAQRDAEEARVNALVDKAVGEQKTKLEGAIALIGDLEKRLGDNDVAGFAKQMSDLQAELKAKSAEIAQIMAAREGKNSIAVAVGKAFNLDKQEDFEESAEKAVLLASIMRKDIGDTEFGSALISKVNQSSSIEVSSDSYETVFSNRILRDIQKLLVVGSMFQELPMSTANLTMQIEPDSGEASWVAAATYGKETTTGNEIKAALTDITFTTFKLAAKAYMTDETEEDVVTSLLPIIRRHLIEAHVKAIEKAFMGDNTASIATGKPTGLLNYAAIDGNIVKTTAKADGTVKVAASMIHALRRKLGLKGLRLESLALIVSMDAYYDLLEDDAWQDMDKVGSAAIKLQGQLGRIYGMPVVVSSYFPAKAADKEYCAIVYRNEFVVPRQRRVTVERERRASEQRDAYYVTQRLNLQRYFNNNVVTGTYAAS